MTPHHGDDRYDLVAFWKQNDSGIYGRRQDMLVKYLALHPGIRRVVHFDAPIAWNRLRARLDFGPDGHLSHGNLVYLQTVTRAMHLADADAITRRTFVYDAERAGGLFPPRNRYLGFIRDVLEQAGIDAQRTIFWVWPGNFDFPEIVKAFSPAMVVADVVDDERRWQISPGHRERLDQNYRAILALSDVVLANCDGVRGAMAELGGTAHLVPNACEPPAGLPSGSPARCGRPPELAGLVGPIVGYAGNLDARRLDVGLLEFVAETRPTWQLVLIGSIHMSPDVLRLRRLPNVHLLGVKRYEEAARYISHFDVALIPHLRNPLTEAMNPLKAFVYCALNVPVVATDVENLDELRDLIAVGRDRSEFVAAIERCLRRGRPGALTGETLELLRTHSWHERVAQIMNLVDDAWARQVGATANADDRTG